MGRMLLMAVAILVAWDPLTSSAQAQSDQQNGQWCAYFTGGPTNCGFATFDDCLQAIKGKTGLCNQNAQYVPPVGADSTTGNRQRHRSTPQ